MSFGSSRHCHQFILSARSPVFKAMFQSNMTEKETQEVVILDMNAQVLFEMLTFMYTGKTSAEGELLIPLLKAADKYQLDMLKNVCIVKLCEIIEVRNCVDFLVIGDMYHAEFLKKFSLKFIAKNVSQVCKSSDWKKILLNYPLLMADVMETFSKMKD